MDDQGITENNHEEEDTLLIHYLSVAVKAIFCLGAFRYHVLRAYHQLHVWSLANNALIPTIDPTEYGWEMKNDEFLPLTTDDLIQYQLLGLYHVYRAVTVQLRTVTGAYVNDQMYRFLRMWWRV